MYVINAQEVNLAKPTPKNVSAFLNFYGKKKLSELFLPTAENIDLASKEFNRIALDSTGDSESAAHLLSICTDKTFTAKEVEDIPVEQIAKVNMDFFFTLILTYYGQTVK